MVEQETKNERFLKVIRKLASQPSPPTVLDNSATTWKDPLFKCPACREYQEIERRPRRFYYSTLATKPKCYDRPSCQDQEEWRLILAVNDSDLQ